MTIRKIGVAITMTMIVLRTLNTISRNILEGKRGDLLKDNVSI